MNSLTLVLATVALVGNDRVATVVLPQDAEPSTVLSATELTNYVFRISGKQVEVRGEGEQKTTPSVFIGTLKTLKDVPERAREALRNAKQFEAAWMGTENGNLWIVGKEETAELYATYHFLETKLGVRWFQAELPEDPGDYVPRMDKIEIEDFAEFREPDFEKRQLCMNSAEYDKIAYPGIVCAYRNGYQFSTKVQFWTQPDDKLKKRFREFYGPRMSRRLVYCGGHLTCAAPLPPQKYLKTNPEYFAIVNGKRHYGWQYCLSNPKLIDFLADYYIKWFGTNDGRGMFAFGQTDNVHGWCECENCRKLDGPGEDAYGNNVCISSRICAFVNALAPRLHAAFPDVELNFEPYSVYRRPPSVGSYPKYMSCQYSPHGRCYAHRFDDPKCLRNVPIWKEMTKWRELLPNRVWTFEYFTDTGTCYICRELMEAEDLRLYKSLGMIGWFNEGFMTGSTWVPQASKATRECFPSNWQWAYATGHLLWDVNLDLQALLDDAESKYYGKAYVAMKPYHALRRRLWKSRNECMGYPYGDSRCPLLLNAAGAKEELLGYLDEADRLAGDDKILQFRLSRDRRWLNDYWIKPNEKIRSQAGQARSIPYIQTPIAVDGDDSEDAWLSALNLDGDRFRVQSESEDGRTAVPADIATSASLATDGKSLYFFIRAKEPHPEKMALTAKKQDDPVWADDGVELSVFSPSVENVYYHIAVNANGVVYDSRCPGNDTSYDLGVEAKGKRTPDGWSLEIRVPTDKIYQLTAGDKWRIQICRSSHTAKDVRYVSLNGTGAHADSEFPVFELGSSLVKNGSFEKVGKDKKPVDWLVNDGEVRREGGKNILFTKGFTCAGAFRHGPLGKSDEPRSLKFSFKAKGKGCLTAAFVRYDDAQKSGEWMPKPWGKGGTWELTDDWKVYSGSYTINPGEYVALGFTPPKTGCLIADVNVTKED